MKDSPINKSVVTGKISFSAPVMFSALMSFRWYSPNLTTLAMNQKVLQQAYQGSDGSIKWQDIPTEIGNE